MQNETRTQERSNHRPSIQELHNNVSCVFAAVFGLLSLSVLTGSCFACHLPPQPSVFDGGITTVVEWITSRVDVPTLIQNVFCFVNLFMFVAGKRLLLF